MTVINYIDIWKEIIDTAIHGDPKYSYNYLWI